MSPAYFDRDDVLSAYRIAKPERFTLIHAPESPADLSENALEIYAGVLAREGRLVRPEHPIANSPSDSPRARLFRMWAGEGYSSVQVYVWADHFEDAFEELTEWLDENAPGYLVSHEYFAELLEDASQELRGKSWTELENEYGHDWDALSDVLEHAEMDLTSIGHTTLKHGAYVPSYGWGGDEVTDADEYDSVLVAATESAQAAFLEQDRQAALDEYADAYKRHELPSRYRDSYERDYSARMIDHARLLLALSGAVGVQS